jgi:hypothetical protein
MSQTAVAAPQPQTESPTPTHAPVSGGTSSSSARSGLKQSLGGKSFDVQAKALSPAGRSGAAEPVQLMPARSEAAQAPVQRRATQRVVQRDAAPPTNDQSAPGGQQTPLNAIDVARNPPTKPGQLGTPVDPTVQSSIDDPLKHPYFKTFEARVVALFASGKVAAPPQPPAAIAADVWAKICSAV